MVTITEQRLLLRIPSEFPKGLKIPTDEFYHGWNLARTMDISRLQKKIRVSGWNFVKIADGSMSSGVGDTSQEAIAGALRLALRRISEHSNVVEFRHIELTQYSWFCLARIGVYAYRIQQNETLPVSEVSDDIPVTFSRSGLLRRSPELMRSSTNPISTPRDMPVMLRSTVGKTQ